MKTGTYFEQIDKELLPDTSAGVFPASRSCPVTMMLLLAYLFVAAGRVHSLIPGVGHLPIPWGIMTGGLLLVSFTMNILNRGIEFKGLIFEEKILIAIFGVAIVGIPVAVWPGGSLQSVIDLFKTSILFFVAANLLRSEREFKAAVISVIMSVLLLCLVSLANSLSHDAKGVTGVYDPNDLALVIVMALPFAFYQLIRSRGVMRLGMVPIIVVFVATAVMTASRGGFVGLLALGGYALLTCRRKVTIAVIACALLVVAVQIAPDSAMERISTIWNPQTDYDRTAGERTTMWRKALGVIADNPLLGVGLGNFSVAEGLSKESGKWMTAHNSFLQIGGELGIPGLVLFALLTVRGLLRLRRFRRATTIPVGTGTGFRQGLALAVEFSLVGFLVCGFFLSQAYLAYLYFMLGMSVAIQKSVAGCMADDRLDREVTA